MRGPLCSESLSGYLRLSTSAISDFRFKACIYGDAELISGGAAKLATMLHALMPETVNEILAFVNSRLLPDPASNIFPRKGSESETAVTRSALTALTRMAESANNQL
jgi:hypothetical protein